eukprot:maker-scaffold_15-snap-gene-1.32-mRNA-1 protein AED:0.39 eAED:0.40 QI:0/0/0/1/0/0/2/0/701
MSRNKASGVVKQLLLNLGIMAFVAGQCSSSNLKSLNTKKCFDEVQAQYSLGAVEPLDEIDMKSLCGTRRFIFLQDSSRTLRRSCKKDDDPNICDETLQIEYIRAFLDLNFSIEDEDLYGGIFYATQALEHVPLWRYSFEEFYEKLLGFFDSDIYRDSFFTGNNRGWSQSGRAIEEATFAVANYLLQQTATEAGKNFITLFTDGQPERRRGGFKTEMSATIAAVEDLKQIFSNSHIHCVLLGPDNKLNSRQKTFWKEERICDSKDMIRDLSSLDSTRLQEKLLYLFQRHDLCANGVQTSSPTLSPNRAPSWSPSGSLTMAPSLSPSSTPSLSPSESPTYSPVLTPSNSPSTSPSSSPSIAVTGSPTILLSTSDPTTTPSSTPTTGPTLSTENPTAVPTMRPSSTPSFSPTVGPTFTPSSSPTNNPTIEPTLHPSVSPSTQPTSSPTTSPSVSTGSPTCDQISYFDESRMNDTYEFADLSSDKRIVDNLCGIKSSSDFPIIHYVDVFPQLHESTGEQVDIIISCNEEATSGFMDLDTPNLLDLKSQYNHIERFSLLPAAILNISVDFISNSTGLNLMFPELLLVVLDLDESNFRYAEIVTLFTPEGPLIRHTGNSVDFQQFSNGSGTLSTVSSTKEGNAQNNPNDVFFEDFTTEQLSLAAAFSVVDSSQFELEFEVYKHDNRETNGGGIRTMLFGMGRPLNVC